MLLGKYSPSLLNLKHGSRGRSFWTHLYEETLDMKLGLERTQLPEEKRLEYHFPSDFFKALMDKAVVQPSRTVENPTAIGKRHLRTSIIVLAVILFSFSTHAQATDDLTTLKKQLDSIEHEQKEIRKELEAIRSLLAKRDNPVPSNAELNLEGAFFKGENGTKVTLVEFFDYKCPFCASYFNQTMPQLDLQYIRTGKLKYVVRDFQFHEGSLKASEAAHCAGDQGKFWLLHDQMMATPKSLDRKSLSLYAQNFGLDVTNFDRCLESNKYAEVVRLEMTEGLKAGVDGTPTFLLGTTSEDGRFFKATQRFAGAVSFDQLKQAIDSLLKEIEKN